MTKWQCLVLGGQCEKITKGTTPTSIGGSFVDHGINFVKVESITQQGSIDKANLAAIDDETHTLLKRSRLAKGDILFSIAGTIGRSCIVDETLLPANTNQAVAIIRLKEHSSLDLRFLYYQLRSEVIAQSVREGVVQAVQANFSLGQLKNLTIYAPSSIHEQRQIASILGALDDKIENNRKTAATLEEMARALYRSWFVDFDPVHAKAAGEKPAFMDEETAALFPDRFGDDGLPEGWTIGALEDIAVLNPEKHNKKSPPAEIEYVDLSNTKHGSIEKTTLFSWDASPSRAQMVLRKMDTIVGTVRPANGSYSYIGRNHLTGSTGFAVLRPQRAEDAVLIYLAATDPETLDALANLADGGAYPAVRPQVIAARSICIAEEGLRNRFSRFVSPFIERMQASSRENELLADLRDTLLPKLMSGEIRVGEAREQVEELT
jgi:type I restriction enzyme S subunit